MNSHHAGRALRAVSSASRLLTRPSPSPLRCASSEAAAEPSSEPSPPPARQPPRPPPRGGASEASAPRPAGSFQESNFAQKLKATKQSAASSAASPNATARTSTFDRQFSYDVKETDAQKNRPLLPEAVRELLEECREAGSRFTELQSSAELLEEGACCFRHACAPLTLAQARRACWPR